MSNDSKWHQNKNDLFTPSLDGITQPTEKTGRRPWTTNAMFLVAFFGGVLAYTVIACINGKRLGVSKDKQLLSVLLGVLGLFAIVLLGYMSGVNGFPQRGTNEYNMLRFGGRIISLLVYFAVTLLQKPMNRIYAYHSTNPQPYESLLIPGIIASVVLGVLQAVFVVFAIDFIPR